MTTVLFSAPVTLRAVCNELGCVKHKAFDVGIQLGVPLDKMLVFKQNDDILSAAVNYWLCGNVSDVPVTWKSVAEALESDFVGEAGLANKIKTKYCHCEDSKDEKG